MFWVLRQFIIAPMSHTLILDTYRPAGEFIVVLLGDIFIPSKSPASGPAKKQSLPTSCLSSRASAREADTSCLPGEEDIFTPRTHRIAPSNLNPSAPPGFALLEPHIDAIPEKPQFTRIL